MGHPETCLPGRRVRATAKFAVISDSSKANPSRGGDAKPGVCTSADGPVADEESGIPLRGGEALKAKAFRLLIALATLSAMAVTLGAGTRWT
jgi:hypothetical protein